MSRTKKDRISDFDGDFEFQDEEEVRLVEKYSKPPIVLGPQMETLIYLRRAIKKGVLRYEDLEEDLQKKIKKGGKSLLEAIKTEFPNFDISQLQKVYNWDSYSQDLYNRISEKITKENIKSFAKLPLELQWDIENNISTDLFNRLKEDFPFFEWPADILFRKADNYEEIFAKTANTHIKRVTKDIPISFQKWDPVSTVLTEYEARVVETNVKGGKRYHWELVSAKMIDGPKRCNFEIFEDPETHRYYVLNKKNNIIYDDIVDYIREEGGTSHIDDFITMMQPPFVEVKDTVKEFRLYYNEKTDKLELPNRNEIYVKNEVIDYLLNRFSFDAKIDEETAREELNRFLKIATPKQLADFLADLGFPIINLINSQIGANVGRIYVCSWGATGTGKTWLHNFAMKYLWGFDYTRDGGFSGNSINRSDFRISLILSSTNLPIFIDEATTLDDNIISTIKASTLSGVNFRGTSNQKAKIYPSTATLILTAQNNIFNSKELSNELALERRFYTNYHNIQINSDDDVDLDTFTADTKTRGYAIYLLQKYTFKELKELYFTIKRKTKDLISTGILFASKLLNLSLEQFSKIEVEMLGTSPLEKIVYWLYYDCEKTNGNAINGNAINDIEAKKLSGMITLKEKDGFKYVAINMNYISYINSINHPLKGKFHDLGDLNQLEPFFEKDEIEKLEGKRIYAGKTVRFGDNTLRSACIPYRYYDDKKLEALNFTERLITAYRDLFYPEEPLPQKQDQLQEQDQPQQLQDQPKDQGQPQQPQNNTELENTQQEPKPNDAEDDSKPNDEQPQEAQKQKQKTTAEAIKIMKENDEKIERVMKLFDEGGGGLRLGHNFEFAPPELRETLESLYRDGRIYEAQPDIWKKSGY